VLPLISPASWDDATAPDAGPDSRKFKLARTAASFFGSTHGRIASSRPLCSVSTETDLGIATRRQIQLVIATSHASDSLPRRRQVIA
jgi:hypothetical protein